jgi:hypothetical protein
MAIASTTYVSSLQRFEHIDRFNPNDHYAKPNLVFFILVCPLGSHVCLARVAYRFSQPAACLRAPVLDWRKKVKLFEKAQPWGTRHIRRVTNERMTITILVTKIIWS